MAASYFDPQVVSAAP